MIRSIQAFFVMLAVVFGALPATVAAQGYLQCAPFARAESGIELYGNASSWWHQAAGRFDRGNQPQVGAVMAMPSTPGMRGGHVAVVTRVLNQREILITHANWSPINGRRGQIERNVKAIDVSPAGDWSQVRVWYAPMNGIGIRTNPVSGFIYPTRTLGDNIVLARADTAPVPTFSPNWKPGNGLGDVVASLQR